MQNSTEAEEHLRVIRSLMEKATIYRAISAPSALVGGSLALIAASFSIAFPGGFIDALSPSLNFTLCWLVVLFFSAAANLHFLRKDAGRRSETFVSPGMRLALASLLPSFVASGVFTVVVGIVREQSVTLVCFWVIFYGLGLLATSHFAPRSIWCLGWAFLFAGLASLIEAFKWGITAEFVRDNFHSLKVANSMMAATFGGFHLIYAACTWPRRVRSVEAAATP